MIAIYAESKSPRLQFVLEVMFQRCLGIDFKFVKNREKLSGLDIPRINYSHHVIEDCLNIVPHGLLFEQEIKPLELVVEDWQGIPTFMRTAQTGDCPFDIFSAAFYLVSRYEEYLDFTPDRHGRFPAVQSLAYQHGFIERPIVNEWAYALVDILKKTAPNQLYQTNTFRFISTIDIDMAFCYRNKGAVRNLGGLFRDLSKLRFDLVVKRLKVLANWEQDPFDNYDYQHQLHGPGDPDLIYFIHVGEAGKHDKNIDSRNINFAFLMDKLASHYPIGIHPSYASNSKKKRLKKEINRLEELILSPINLSRQHYIKFRFPGTFRKLWSMGIEQDFSLGYAEIPGFRASICVPIPFFDLEKNSPSELLLRPFVVMDVSLKHYLKLNQEQAIKKIEDLMLTVKKFRGEFISIFHNESLSDYDVWKGWRIVYEATLKMGSEKHDKVSD